MVRGVYDRFEPALRSGLVGLIVVAAVTGLGAGPIIIGCVGILAMEIYEWRGRRALPAVPQAFDFLKSQMHKHAEVPVSRVEIVISSDDRREIAETIQSAYQRAEWASDIHDGNCPPGITVQGASRDIVQEAAHALTSAGLGDVATDFTEDTSREAMLSLVIFLGDNGKHRRRFSLRRARRK